jgi:hypothetical protein
MKMFVSLPSLPTSRLAPIRSFSPDTTRRVGWVAVGLLRQNTAARQPLHLSDLVLQLNIGVYIHEPLVAAATLNLSHSPATPRE